MFIVIGLSVLAVSTAVVLLRRRARGGPDLGCVSEGWLAEYRSDASRPTR